MPITAEQRKARRNFIGSSDSPAIMGYDHRRNAATVWAEKVFEPEEQAEPENIAATIGNVLEPALVDWVGREIGAEVLRDQNRIGEDGIMAANHDGLVVGRPEGVEAKTVGIVGRPVDKEAWDPDVGCIPDRVLIQVHHQMLVSHLERVYVPALIGNVGLHLFTIERNEDLIKSIAETGAKFWREFVQTKTPPPDSVANLEVMTKIKREPNKCVPIDGDLVRMWLDVAANAKVIVEEEERLKAAVVQAMGDAESAEFDGGLLTYLMQSRRGVDSKLLKEKYPKIAEEVEKVSTFRVLRKKLNKVVA